MTFELTKEYVELIRKFIENEDIASIHSEMEGLFPADITNLLYELDSAESKFLFEQLEVEIGSEIMAALEPEERKEFLKSFSSHEISRYVNLFRFG